jgi:hypothetical protein
MQPEPPVKKKPSPLAYVGCGCAVLGVVGVLALVAFFLFAGSQVEQFQTDMASDASRTAQAEKLLGAQGLPPGYFSVLVLSVPMVADTVVLSTYRADVPANLQKGEVRMFQYLAPKTSSSQDVESFAAYLEGRSQDSTVLARSKIQLKTREVVSRGVLEYPGRKLRYLTQRGELISSEHERPGPVLSALVLFDCPGTSTLRMGLWTAPDPAPQTPLRKLDTTGTPVDVNALSEFMSHLNPCLAK